MLALGWLRDPLQRCLDDLEQQMFGLADQARDPFNQQRHFASRQKLLHERARFEQAFMDAVSEAIGELGAIVAPPAAAAAPLTLSLLDTSEQEMTLALDKLASRGEARGGSMLYELSFRLAVLVSMPPLDGDRMPLGARALAQAMRKAHAAIALADEYELLLLKSYESSFLAQLPQLYTQINALLAADGILTELRPFPLARAPKAARAHTSTSAPASEDSPNADAPSMPPHRPAPAFAPASLSRHDYPRPGAAPSHYQSIAVLDSLRELLAHRPASRADVDPSGAAQAHAAGPIATSEELQSALHALQQHLTEVTDQASRELRSAQRLREELLKQLNVGKPAGAHPTGLSSEQGDTVELVAMLFEQLSRQLHQGEEANALLGGLQMPVLRMAVSDRNFFDQKEHPARQLLGKVTEAAHDWLDDKGSDPDRSLRDKLEQLVERASREPPSAGLYTSLLADIQQHLNLLSRKAQAAERRHVEAMQGRERLEQARQRAGDLMTERFARTPPRGLLRALLDRAWSDVLALTLLRHGETSEAFINQLAITDQLLGHLAITDRAQLRSEVETGLQQIGMHQEEAAQVAQRLINPTDVPISGSQDVLSNTDLAMRLKQHKRLGENLPKPSESPAAVLPVQADTALPAPDARPAPDPRSAAPPSRSADAISVLKRPPPHPRELKMQDQLRQMAFGSWLEFTDRKTGQISQRKLAWYSPISGRALLVTRRGQRSDEVTLAQIAHEMVRGRARRVEETSESLIDRAWSRLTRSLLKPAGGSGSGPDAGAGEHRP